MDMGSIKFIITFVLILMLVSCNQQNTFGKAYYICHSGSQNNNGSLKHPFNRLDSTIISKFNAGNTIYFKGGEVFETSLYVNSLNKGTKKNPIVITFFGKNIHLRKNT